MIKIKYFILLVPILLSCKTNKNYQCNCYTEYVQKDTIILTTEHINFNGKCSMDTTMINCISDTLRIPKKYYVNN